MNSTETATKTFLWVILLALALLAVVVAAVTFSGSDGSGESGNPTARELNDPTPALPDAER